MQSGSITEFGTARTIEQRANMQRVINWLADGAPHTTLKDGSVLEGFDYTQYIAAADYKESGDGSTTGQCGTVGCIAGAAVQFDSPITIPSEGDAYKYWDLEQQAQGLLGLCVEEGELLFYPFDLSVYDIRRMHEEYGLGYSADYLDISFSENVEDLAEDDFPLEQLRCAEPEQIARVLQLFQDTGVIDWHILEN